MVKRYAPETHHQIVPRTPAFSRPVPRHQRRNLVAAHAPLGTRLVSWPTVEQRIRAGATTPRPGFVSGCRYSTDPTFIAVTTAFVASTRSEFENVLQLIVIAPPPNPATTA